MKRKQTVRVNVVLPITMHDALQAAAKRQKRTYSSVMREAIAEYLGVPDTIQLGGHFQRGERQQNSEDKNPHLAGAGAR